MSVPNNDKWYLGELEAKAVYAGTTQLYPHPEINKELSWPIEISGNVYEQEDAHIFVANGNAVHFATGTNPTLVAVDNIVMSYETEVKGNSFDGSIIHAIFDWDNENQEKQNWFSDILQFGLNSETGFRNQLKNGKCAFYYMTANPFSIPSLYINNLTDMSDMFAHSSFNRSLTYWDTTAVVYFNGMFYNAKQFNGDVHDWDTTSAKNMNGMFKETDNFNQDISEWNTISVTSMAGMFENAKSFNQDLSQWCVSEIASTPPNFDSGANAWTMPASRPDWGNCPRLEGIETPDEYTKLDCHIFVANGNLINLPIPTGTLPTFVAVNGVDVTPTSFVTRTVEVEEIGADGVRTTSTEEIQTTAISANDGDIIHAIFDWNNKAKLKQNWFSDILQFGLNSETGKRRQLADTYYAFRFMEANPISINYLDVSNAKSMEYVFTSSPTFNQDLKNWDTSNVTNMQGLFSGATSFNSDLSQWNTSKVENMYTMFYNAKSFNSDISKWNTWRVTNMSAMFAGAEKFNQSLSSWCVSPEPQHNNFDDGASAWIRGRPIWGTCQSQNNNFPGGYSLEDCHVFISNGYPIQLAVQGGKSPVFVSINGEDVTEKYNANSLSNPLPGDIVLAIFDWKNTTMSPQDWFSDILQFGLNSETGRRNQLNSGYRAFYKLKANPSVIANLDVSNLHDMNYMFKEAVSFNKDLSNWEVGNVKEMRSIFNSASVFNNDITNWDVSNVTNMESMFYNALMFNQDISEWDTSNVDNMSNMFSWAKSFNQDLNLWCVSKTKYWHNFDLNAIAWTLPYSRPQWGTCPRGEDGN